MRIRNSDYVTKFFNTKTLEFVDPLREGVRLSSLNSQSLKAHIGNCLRMSQRPDTYVPVLENVVPIPPRTSWAQNQNSSRFYQLNKSSFSTRIRSSVGHVARIARKASNLVSSRIAVELSGGLDTALVIGVLQSVGVKPYLVGAVSERYEFRTERSIQEKIAKTVSHVHFIREEETLPFANLKSTPVHALPNKSSLFFFLNSVTAEWAASMGIQHVVNGIGFDSILIDAIGKPCDRYVFDLTNLEDGWANDYVFHPKGVAYVNAASLSCVLRAIIRMRTGQSEDPQKVWARTAFRQFLPHELSNYRYKATFDTVYESGLMGAEKDIFDMCDKVYELTRLPELNPIAVSRLSLGLRNLDHSAEFEFLARLSYLNWVYQLDRAGLIDHSG